MSNKGFFKIFRSDVLEDLIFNHPNAFRLLTLIALHAKRDFRNPKCKLELGQVLLTKISHWNFTRQTIRTAICNLQSTNQITTKSTNKGTIVTLINTDVYDINIKDDNHQNNQQKNQDLTTQTQKSNHPAIYNKGVKNIRNKEVLPLASSMLAEFNESLLKRIPDFCKDELPKTEKQISAMQTLINRYTEEVVRNIFIFAHQHHFWFKVVHTPIILKKNFEKIKADLSQPSKVEKLVDNKTKVLEKFKHGEIYNGAECFITDNSIAFQRGYNHKELKFKEFGFEDQLNNILRNFQIVMEKI